MSDNGKLCNLYTYNTTDPFHLGNTYGGLPTNLVTNLIGWTLLMLMFLIVRKSAFKFVKLKRLEHITSDLNLMGRITKLFFSGNINAEHELNPGFSSRENLSACGEPPADDPGDHSDAARSGEHRVVFDDQDNLDDSDELLAAAETPGVGFQHHQSHGSHHRLSRTLSIDEETGFWSWLVKVFTLTDSQLKALAGADAQQYLRFQRYIIGYLMITTTLSIGVILPLNFQGDLQGNSTEFGHTTLSNLDPESPFLWVHITIAFLLFPVAIYMMRKFSKDLKFRDPGLELTRTLCVENIPEHMCQDIILRRHFHEAYPSFKINDVKVAFDVSELTDVNDQLLTVKATYDYAVRHKEKTGEDLRMYPHCASRCCCCVYAPCSARVTVVDFYHQKLVELEAKVEKRREISLNSPLGMAFVTFQSVNDAKQVYEDHEKNVLRMCREQRPLSSLSTSMKTENWKIWFAPPPKDIYWENLSDRRNWLFLKMVVSNVVLFVVTFFLTTPEYALTQFDTILISMFGPSADISALGGSWFKDFVPTVMLWSFTAMLPLLVSYSDRWLGRWTRSEENHSVMRKTFWYLLFMVIILPTFGFTTGQAYFNFLFMDGNKTDTYKWECIFLPDSGAFFVNYVVTAALIGSGLELIRFPDMVWYLLQLCFSKTEAEAPAIQRALTYEFRFGEHYARMLLIFAMVMMYSLSCPLITPFGCLYFLLKHFADRHNLAFVYAPSKINKKVHASAINFVIMSVGLLQFFMVVFSIIRSGSVSYLTARTKYALVLFVITINIFTAQIWSAFCRKLSPIMYEDVLYVEDDNDEHNQSYVPPVLKDVYRGGESGVDTPAPAETSPDPASYGTFVSNLVDVNTD